MCKYCDIDSDDCEYFMNPLDGVWYQDIETGEWDSYNDGYVHQINYGVKYCQYCGRKLNEES